MPTLEVSPSPQTDATGIFMDAVWSTGYESRPGGGSIRVSPERSSSPDRFWNQPGTYYWHAYRVDCPVTGPRPHTCAQRAMTPTRSFTISSHALALTVAAAHRRMRLRNPLAVRIGCSSQCRVRVTVLARGKRLFDAARGLTVSAHTETYKFSPRPLKRFLGARKSMRLTIRVTARDHCGQRAIRTAGTTLVT
jgi:hypothetical protein